MFWDETAPFPDYVLKLGHYSGPSMNVGPAMTTKILTWNGQVLHIVTYRPLTSGEIADKDRLNAQDQFIFSIYEMLESQILLRELEDPTV